MTTDPILPDFVQGPIDRLTLALYAGASGDHTLIHLDPEAAKGVGLPDVIGHGLLSMAIMGRALKHWFGFREAKSLAVRFSAPVFLGDMIRCAGTVAERREENGEVEYALDLIGYANDRKILTGTATVRVSA
jgi:acyl dehydratase